MKFWMYLVIALVALFGIMALAGYVFHILVVVAVVGAIFYGVVAYLGRHAEPDKLRAPGKRHERKITRAAERALKKMEQRIDKD